MPEHPCCGHRTATTDKPCENRVGPGTTMCAAGHPVDRTSRVSFTRDSPGDPVGVHDFDDIVAGDATVPGETRTRDTLHAAVRQRFLEELRAVLAAWDTRDSNDPGISRENGRAIRRAKDFLFDQENARRIPVVDPSSTDIEEAGLRSSLHLALSIWNTRKSKNPAIVRQRGSSIRSLKGYLSGFDARGLTARMDRLARVAVRDGRLPMHLLGTLSDEDLERLEKAKARIRDEVEEIGEDALDVPGTGLEGPTTYSESARGTVVSYERAIQELRDHCLGTCDSVALFHATLGVRKKYSAAEVLAYLGY